MRRPTLAPGQCPLMAVLVMPGPYRILLTREAGTQERTLAHQVLLAFLDVPHAPTL